MSHALVGSHPKPPSTSHREFMTRRLSPHDSQNQFHFHSAHLGHPRQRSHPSVCLSVGASMPTPWSTGEIREVFWEGSSISMCQTVGDRHKGYLDAPDSLSLHYLSTLTELPGKSFWTQSDTEASQYGHCKSLIKKHASPKQTGSTENLSPTNCLQNFPKHSFSANNKWSR